FERHSTGGSAPPGTWNNTETGASPAGVRGHNLPQSGPALICSFQATSFRFARKRKLSHMAIRHSGGGLGGLDIEASQCVLPQKADCRDSVEGNRHPHTAQLRKLHSDMDVLDPKGGALGGYSFNSADTESTRIYPDLPVQKVFILPLRDDPQNVLRNDAEVL